MPKDTFLNLPSAKKKKLIAAIKAELKRVPFEQVSINRIIKDAEISRGSFYQYFDDKYDMLTFALMDCREQFQQVGIESLKEHHGDLFLLMRDMFDFTLSYALENEAHEYCKTLFSNGEVISKFYLTFGRDQSWETFLPKVKQYLDFTKLKVSTDQDIKDMLEVLAVISSSCITEAFMDLNHVDEVRRSYYRKLELVQRGFINE